jgi:hypothetical protein
VVLPLAKLGTELAAAKMRLAEYLLGAHALTRNAIELRM